MSRGFSIIELLVITAIIATFSVVLILNFRSSPTSRTAREQTASVILSDVRRAQSLALSGSRYQGNLVCGYGVHYINPTSYLLYAKAVPASGPCFSVATRNYQAGDPIVETKILINVNMEIRSVFDDVFFEPPDPKTYIDDEFDLEGSPSTITVQLKGQQNCGQKSCTKVVIYPTGQIDMTN
ncbi:MAG: type II secretion system protein [Candidatus Yanofskybacteria bacterium]|nr:type II secretion system protein [Candidatus Yanofskybacteria bacterium]